MARSSTTETYQSSNSTSREHSKTDSRQDTTSQSTSNSRQDSTSQSSSTSQSTSKNVLDKELMNQILSGLMGTMTDEQITQLTTGMMIDGRRTAPAEVRIVTREPERVVMEVILYEGRNRQIRKMCEALGLEVARLKRTAIGNVKLGMLHPGDWRQLTDREVASLTALAKAPQPK